MDIAERKKEVAMTLTENGALSYTSMGSELLDQFGHSGTYMGRQIETVFNDQELLFEQNELMALRFPFYLRMITRKVRVNKEFVTDKVQKGQGLRDESFKRLLYVAKFRPSDFYRNIWVLPMIGSWKDIFTLMFYDQIMNVNVIDMKIMYTLLAQGIKCDEHRELIKKYMPRIESVKKCKTDWTKFGNEVAMDFAQFVGWTEKEYNEFKSSGVAHDFQKKICGGMYDKLNWNAIPGKALSLITSSKFLSKHNLVNSYTEWITNQPIAKFNGYVHDLGVEVMNNGRTMPYYKEVTIDKQFNSLINTIKEEGTFKENVLCALDTSGSMHWDTLNNKKGLMPITVALSLGLYFSELNQGYFHRKAMLFDNTSRFITMHGEMFSQRMRELLSTCAMGGTNFQSIIDELCNFRRKNGKVPLEDYPTTILVVSDMQFNPTEKNVETNYQAMKRKLYEVFPTEFVDKMKFVWWFCTSRSGVQDYPTTMEDGGSYVFSGFDGAILSLLLGKEVEEKVEKKQPSMEEIVFDALNQEILQQVKLKD